MHFNLNQSLKQSECDSVDCKTVEIIVPISPELINNCKIQNSMNEKEMNFQYLDVEFLNSNYDLQGIVSSMNEDNAENSSSSEEKI